MSHNLTPSIPIPSWAEALERANLGKTFPSNEDKLRFAILLATENVKHHTGAPFGAAIFDRTSHTLIAIGIHRVVPANQSWAHAEMTAYAHTQHRLQTYCLKGCTIATSCEPCAMCCGATPWSGVEQMLYAATKQDAENAGFDEDDKADNWVASFNKRNIEIIGPSSAKKPNAPLSSTFKMKVKYTNE
jgi:tRNA(Arg) A34 adenosine deaminase TadA